MTLLAVLVFSFSVLAQEEPVPVVPQQQDPTPGSETQRERDLPVLRSSRVAANAIVGGTSTNGDVVLDGSDTNYATAGVLLRASSGSPNIAARLGTSTSGSAFSVFSLANTNLFTVNGAGSVGIGTAAPASGSDVHILRNDVFTTLRVEHLAAGTSGAARGARVQFYENGTLKAAVGSIGSGSTGSIGGADALQLWNYANGAIVMATNNTERLRIQADGSIGVGINTPSSKFQVFNGTTGIAAFAALVQTGITTNGTFNDTAGSFNAIQSVSAGVTNGSGAITGVVANGFLYGAGVVNDTYGVNIKTGVYTGHTGTANRATGLRVAVINANGAGTVGLGTGVRIDDVKAQTAYGLYQEGSDDVNFLAGKTRIGANPSRSETLVVTGDAYFTGTVTGGNIKAHYQDLAEWVPANADLAPGTVVVLHPERPNEVIASATAYDTSVAGVVSAQPGIVLGEEGTGKEQIATTGRVKVRVDARTSPVRIGDLLVTSDVPGTAMKSQPMEIGGHSFHKPGTIVGKALEPLAGGVGEILVLLSLQ